MSFHRVGSYYSGKEPKSDFSTPEILVVSYHKVWTLKEFYSVTLTQWDSTY